MGVRKKERKKQKGGDQSVLFAETEDAKKAVRGNIRSERRFRSSLAPCEPGRCRCTTISLLETRGSPQSQQRAPGSTRASILRVFGRPWKALGQFWAAPGSLFRLLGSILNAKKTIQKSHTGLVSRVLKRKSAAQGLHV